MYFFSFLLIFLTSSLAAANLDLSREPKWIRLLHYKQAVSGKFISEADGPGFFLDKEGKTDPLKELNSSILAFGSELSPGDDHPICKFPLRYKWLNQKLDLPWKADLLGCRKYLSFLSKLAAKRASIVFSSYYLSNPNSAFGHTLLRLSRYDDSNETQILDYGINYAADAHETNPLVYAVKGLAGGFKGKFAAIPYYYKIREYSNFEFRDLWSYELNLTMPQVLEMVDHIWELGNTHFDYFYFRENCSYHLLGLIEVALPEKQLTSQFHLFTIPADTIRLLRKEGLIADGRRRESTYSKLSRLSADLDKSHLETAKEIAKHPAKTDALVKGSEDKTAAQVLDVSLEAFDYFNFEKILTDDLKTKEQKSFILKRRALNPVISADDQSFAADQTDSPAFSHAPTRATLAQGYVDELGGYTRLELRAAIHDLLDPPRGSLKDAQLEIGRLSLSYQKKNSGGGKVLLDQVSFFTIKNYPPQNYWASPLSWEVDLGFKEMRRVSCFDCPGAFVVGSVGNSLGFLDDRILVALLANGEIDVQGQFVHNYRLGVGPKLYLRYKANDTFLTGLSTYYHFNSYREDRFFEDTEWVQDFESRYHLTADFSLALKVTGNRRDGSSIFKGELGLQYFY
ncbi:MAG TPA: DUF4105 domain-containing protein [Bacteriovoracaceae bacterium]|nr:DUF4105 domain-containing protein [Bacteriovoracaceae bacterium]